MTPMILVEALTKVYGRLKAVDDLSFSVAGGEVLGLIGPNGAGKTTTLRCIVGIQAPSAGAIHIGGHDIVADPIEAKRRLAFMPDEPQLFDYLTVREHLALVARLYGVDSRGAVPEPARGAGTGRQGGRAARRAVARHEAEAGHRLRPAARPGGAAVRRAPHGARPPRHPPDEADDRRARARQEPRSWCRRTCCTWWKRSARAS